MSKILGIVAALSVAMSIVLYQGIAARSGQPTPLADFSAPFVFGRFQPPSDNPLTREAVELGRQLFYDPRLSGNNTVSCSTCHEQQLAFTDGKQVGVGVSGRPLAFNSMSLANLMWGPRRFFWDGRVASLEEQSLIPIQHPDEMAQDLDELVDELAEEEAYREQFDIAYGKISAATIAAALASFQRILVSANSRYDQFLRGEIALSETEELGRKLFMAHPDVKVSLRGGNCIDCHSQFLTSGFNTRFDGFTNNGLDSEEDLPAGLQKVTGKPEHRGLFKVPTLRNVALTAPYMHDGRFETLEEVLDHYNEGIKTSSTLSPLILEADNLGKESQDSVSLNLTEDEKTAIIAFLHTLTDHEFVAAERFSNPFSSSNGHGAQTVP
ncbi:MAG: cytochrome c peroxidase [Gemmatimonadota bacterium]